MRKIILASVFTMFLAVAPFVSADLVHARTVSAQEQSRPGSFADLA